ARRWRCRTACAPSVPPRVIALECGRDVELRVAHLLDRRRPLRGLHARADERPEGEVGQEAGDQDDEQLGHGVASRPQPGRHRVACLATSQRSSAYLELSANDPASAPPIARLWASVASCQSSPWKPPTPSHSTHGVIPYLCSLPLPLHRWHR